VFWRVSISRKYLEKVAFEKAGDFFYRLVIKKKK